jgi:tRNA 2-selenouridine synthase
VLFIIFAAALAQMEYLDPESFLLPDHVPLIDVRSPGEYHEGHIPGAINIPLFTDEERALVGTAYKQEGRQEAISIGLDLVGPRLRGLSDRARSAARENRLRVYCWRGGMRSAKMAWLFELSGLNTTLLKGGYKAYRQAALDGFRNIRRLIVLEGATGSGKTEMLQHMCGYGEQVIDLEAFARHKGSAFGGIGLPEQPGTMQFQNDIYHLLRTFDAGRRIWVEGESMYIGKVCLPEGLWQVMNRSPRIHVEVDKRVRARRLASEYGVADPASLIQATHRIAEKFGGDRCRQAAELIGQGALEDAAFLLLDYYDKTYLFSRGRHKSGASYTMNCSGTDIAADARAIVQLADQHQL